MKESSLPKLSLITSVAGLVILLFASRTFGLDRIDIAKITPEDIGKNVRVCGQVSSKSVSKTQHTFLEVKDGTGKIDITVFNTSSAKTSAQAIEKNQDVCITGTVGEYRNNLQITLGNGKIEAG